MLEPTGVNDSIDAPCYDVRSGRTGSGAALVRVASARTVSPGSVSAATILIAPVLIDHA